jgi:indole-3-glycerol phosphate synthase
MSQGTILDEILARKRARPLRAVQRDAAQAPRPRDLAAALRRPGVSLIAEIKRASPSKGLLAPDLDPARLAATYEANGAAAISVLTDAHYFQGSLQDLQAARSQVNLPVLRKDFVVDPYQVYEARAARADAVLAIAAALDDDGLAGICRLADELGMAALVEVHDEGELRRALAVGPRIVGVNNRDLRTFRVDLETTARLRPLIPAGVLLVAESGVHTADDVARLAAIGVDAMLVGESLVRSEDPGRQVRALLAGQRAPRPTEVV